MGENMHQLADMTNAADAALERVRGELATLELALAVLKGSMDRTSMSVDRYSANLDSTDNSADKARDWPSLHGIDRVLSRDLLLPEYGAILAPDERTYQERTGDHPRCWTTGNSNCRRPAEIIVADQRTS